VKLPRPEGTAWGERALWVNTKQLMSQEVKKISIPPFAKFNVGEE